MLPSHLQDQLDELLLHERNDTENDWVILYVIYANDMNNIKAITENTARHFNTCNGVSNANQWAFQREIRREKKSFSSA